jgi:hypothetical protein
VLNGLQQAPRECFTRKMATRPELDRPSLTNRITESAQGNPCEGPRLTLREMRNQFDQLRPKASRVPRKNGSELLRCHLLLPALAFVVFIPLIWLRRLLCNLT